MAVLRAVLGLALTGSVFVQTVMLWLVWLDLDGLATGLRAALVAALFLGIVCLQVIGVTVWLLVSMVRRGTVFSPRSFGHVDRIIAAIAVGAVLIFAIAVIAALGTIAPGVVLLQCGASFVAAGVALVVFVMRVLLQQAVETATRADALQSELDGVI